MRRGARVSTDLVTARYLATYAQPEAGLASMLRRDYGTTLVVPVHREAADLLSGFEAAARGSDAPVLAIVVINEHEQASAGEAKRSELLLRDVIRRLDDTVAVDPYSTLGRIGLLDVLVVDRVSPSRRVPMKQAVGLARKIGFDIALAAHVGGRCGPLSYTTDADATLPEGHFCAAGEPSSGASALIHRFEHTPSGDAAIDRATQLHELFLRYWVAGLRDAGSPYAFHTVGSTLAVSLPAYARVRGVPRRAAGEDFYLLTKLAKLAPIERRLTSPVRLASRRSARTPFGTGRAVERLTTEELTLIHPSCFAVLGRVVHALDRLAVHAELDVFESQIRAEAMVDATVNLVSPDARRVLGRLCREATDSADRRTRLHTWFDAFRTMKLLHGLRDAAFGVLPWREALTLAPFITDPGVNLSRLLRNLDQEEMCSAKLMGPTPRVRS